jgi:glycosyltransferase 2 family protein
MRLAHHREGAYHLDEMIRRFYVRRRPHFFTAAGWCLLGWCGGLLETYIVLRLLAPGRGWATALAAESLAMLLNNMFLFVPGRVGTAESVRTGVFVLLGLPASTGVAYGLVRRAREILWVLPGLVTLHRHPVAIAPHHLVSKPELAGSEQAP